MTEKELMKAIANYFKKNAAKLKKGLEELEKQYIKDQIAKEFSDFNETMIENDEIEKIVNEYFANLK